MSDVEVPAVSNPSTTITRVPIAELKLNRRNPRVHSERQIEQLSKSIKSFGFLWPVMIDGTRRVLAGHGRIEAAKRLGFQEVPTISIHHLSQYQQRAFMIADNRLAEQASWDEKLLAEQLKELCDVELDFDLEATGFEVGEIDVLIEGVSPRLKGNSDPADDLPETKPVAVTRVGDLWLVGPHRIYCGNPLDPNSYSVLMGSDRAAMVLTDPPFNVEVDGHATGPRTPPHRKLQVASRMTEAEFTDFLTQVMQRCAFYTVEGSLHYAFTDWRRMAALLVAGKEAYSELMDVCVWVNDNDDRGLLYKRRHELIFVFKSGKESHSNNIRLGHQERCRTNVWNYRRVKPFCHSADEGHLPELHPSTKPVALVAEAIMDCTSRRDIVLDPFLRSGTTVIAAERTSRVCYGIELDPQYVDTIVRRCQAFTGQSARLECSGRTFAELEQEAGNAVKG